MSEKTAKGNSLLRGERLQIMLDKGELDALEDFRFDNRLPSRAAAVRELLRRGLEAGGFMAEHPDSASNSYGVLRKVDGADGSRDPSSGSDGGDSA